MKLFLLTKKDHWCITAVSLAREKGFAVTHCAGDRKDPFPKELDALHLRDQNLLKDQILISFLSPWIVPAKILEAVKLAINIHPAPPKYPGTGCYNFALFHQEKEYGVTAHLMLPKVDSGEIIKVRYFPLYATDTVYALKQRSMDQAILLFEEILEMLQNNTLMYSREVWQRKPYTRKDLIALCDLTRLCNDSLQKVAENQEFLRTIKSTQFPNAQDKPFIKIGKHTFFLEDSENGTNT